MPEYIYPTSQQLSLIEPEKLDALTQNDPLFSIMPIVNKDTHVVSWEQRDNVVGLQQVRGLNGQPSRVQRLGGKRYTMQPGVYGEYTVIDEQELVTRRQWGTEDRPIDITDLVTEAQDQLLMRRIDRIRFIGWQLLVKGQFVVTGPTGNVLHADEFPITQYVAAVTWATSASATPLADFRRVKLLARGKSTSFGAGARVFMNQVTFNRMMENTNPNDLAGRRTIGLNTLTTLNLDEVNRMLAAESGPQIVIYEEGYYDENGVWNLYIPDGVAVVIGVRANNAPVAEYIMTRNANNPGLAAGAYTKVKDDPNEVPHQIEVHDGHNGGPAIYYPGSIVIMRV